MNFDIANLIMNIGQSNSKDWIDIFSALLTPVVAIFATYIAYQQWKTTEIERKQKLFEMRYDNLYQPIYICSENITNIKDGNYTNIEKTIKIEQEIQKFWNKYSKYKFLITMQDDEKLSHHYRYIIEIIRNHKASTFEENPEGLLPMLALLLHVASMEDILSKYLRIESDTLIFRIKIWLRYKFNSLNKNNKNLQQTNDNKEAKNDL